ncbi:CoA-transferase family III [Hypoxylon sp. FL1857]|nr:CoA-transferase family III [Hypoxylon sp. FL1857]
MESSADNTVPKQAEFVFMREILENPLMPNLPPELAEIAKFVSFEGNAKPSIPVNWRLAESISALKAFEATFLNYLAHRKYGIRPRNVSINTDHATLFLMSPMLTQIEDRGEVRPFSPFDTLTAELFPNRDKHRANASLQRALITNIYKTKDGRFYHTHGGMNPEPTLQALGLPLEDEVQDTSEVVVDRIQQRLSQYDATHLDHLLNEEHRQAGTIVYSSAEYFASEHGQKNGKVGLYEIIRDPNSPQPATWWPDHPNAPSSPKRPLAGLKVVDLTRAIAGPTITRSLAEMGASVMRVTSPDITDMSVLHQDLNWGKWNSWLRLDVESDRQKLRDLILDADVVVDSYRPGVMERFGFGHDDVFNLVRNRDRGIIYVRENCYGWYGPWSHRSGWQQISDACCGISTSYGHAMGLEEPVTPALFNSDYCTGICGSTAVLDALVQRAEKGGSYRVDVSINYYNQWLVRSVGIYDEDTWTDLFRRHDAPVFRHYHSMQSMLPKLLTALYKFDSEILFQREFFAHFRSGALNTTFIQIRPIARFKDDAIELKYNVGTRGNGVDAPTWPADLRREIVSSHAS